MVNLSLENCTASSHREILQMFSSREAFENDFCPVRDELLGEMYRANENGRRDPVGRFSSPRPGQARPWVAESAPSEDTCQLADRFLMLLVLDLAEIAGDLEQHALVWRDLPRTFLSDPLVEIADRRAQCPGDLK